MLTEHQEQSLLCKYLSTRGLLFYAVPNGGLRNVVVAKKLKSEGVQPGVPDVVIAEPRGGYHGLYIEMKKSKGGSLTSHQKEWIENLNTKGYLAVMCKGAGQAIDCVEKYLNCSNQEKER